MEGEREERRISIEGGANQQEQFQEMNEVEQNPLLMPTVMSALFRQMTMEELANCRQVCREWLNGSLLIWRSTSTINLSNGWGSINWSSERVSINLSNNWGWGWGPRKELDLSVHKFHKFWEVEGNKCAVMPFARFRIFESGFHPNSELDGYLGGSLGVNLTHLTMHGCLFTSLDQFLEVVCRACPNLQNLVIKCSLGTGSEYNSELNSPSEPYKEPEFGELTKLKSLTLSVSSYLPIHWLKLLSHFPALDNITVLNNECADDKSGHLEILEAVKTIRARDPRKLLLKHYGATLELYHDRFGEDPISISYGSDLLRQLRIPCASIIIWLDDNIDRELVKSVLKLHAETIKYMSFQNYDKEEDQPFEFPSGVQFPNLQTLRIINDRSINTWNFENLNFLQYTPNITDLQINQKENETVRFQSHYLFSNSMDLLKSDLKLTKLRNLNVDFTVSVKNLRCLTRWFPNVEKIQMTLNVAQIKLAFKRWEHLSELAPHPFQPEDEEVKEFRLAAIQERMNQDLRQ